MKLKATHYILLISSVLLVSACNTAKTAQKDTVPVNTHSVATNSKGGKEVDSVNVERFFIDGCKFVALADYENAINTFEEVLKMDPNNDASMYQLAKIYLNYSKYSDAAEYARKAVQIKPDNVEYEITYADILTYGGSYKKASELLEKVLLQTPLNADIYFRLSYNYEKDSDVSSAIGALKKLEAVTGPDEQVLMELQRLYNINKQPEKAIGIMQQLLQMDPLNPTYLRFLSEYYEQAGDPEMAEKTFDILLQTDTDNTDLQFRKASLQFKAGDKQNYFATMHKAFANPAGDIDTKIFYLVLFVDSIGKPAFRMQDSVIEWTRLLVQAHPEDAKSYAMRGDFLYYSDKPAEARESYSKSVALRSDVYDVWVKLFYINSDLRQYDSLKVVTENAMEYFPVQPLSYYFNGVALNQLNKHEDAANVLKRGLPLAVSNLKLKADMYTELGDAYNELKNYTESDAAFENSLKINPDNPFALNNYAYYLSERKDHLDHAAEMASHAIELVPNNSNLEDTYAWILYQQKKYNDAKNWLEKALQHGGDKSGTVNEHYGDVLYQLGDVDKALEYWIKAKAAGDASDLIDKKISDKKLYE